MCLLTTYILKLLNCGNVISEHFFFLVMRTHMGTHYGNVSFRCSLNVLKQVVTLKKKQQQTLDERFRMMYKHVSFHPTSFCVSNFSSFPTLFTALKTTGRSITDFAEANKCHTQTHREESRTQEVTFHQKKQCHIL